MSFFDTILDTAGTPKNTGIERAIQAKPVIGESHENEKTAENHKNGPQNDAARQSPGGEKQKTPHSKPEKLSFLRPCPLCGGRHFIYGTAGGFFCAVCQPGIPGQSVQAAGLDRLPAEQSSIPAPEPTTLLSMFSDKQFTNFTTNQGKENFAAAWPWLKEKMPVLLAAGWSRARLLRRGKYRNQYSVWGVAWLSVWRKPFLTVTIGAHGEIVFKYQSCGRSITQTAFPEVSFFQAQKKIQVEPNIGARNPRETPKPWKDP